MARIIEVTAKQCVILTCIALAASCSPKVNSHSKYIRSGYETYPPRPTAALTKEARQLGADAIFDVSVASCTGTCETVVDEEEEDSLGPTARPLRSCSKQ